MPVKVQQLASKKSAMASARAKTESKSAQKRKSVQSKPASKKATPKKKTVQPLHKSKKPAKAKETKLVKVDPKLQTEADQIEKEMPELVGNYASSRVAILERAVRVEKKKLWKLMSAGYTSFSAWLEKYAEDADTSVRTLRLGLGFVKATPQLTTSQREAIGPRKGAKITAAAKAAEAKGETLDPEILDKAAERTEEEVRADLVARGLIVETQPTAESEYHEPTYDEVSEVLSGSATGQFYSVPAEGDYGAQSAVPDHGPFENVPHATPEPGASEIHARAIPFGEDTEAAIAEARLIYGEEGETRRDSDWIEFCLSQWRKTQCLDDMRFPNQTNAQAADSLKPKKGNGKRKK